MTTAALPKNPVPNYEEVRDDWLSRVAALVRDVERWAGELGWATRVIDKRMDDSQIGPYVAPALLLQKETTRLLLEPVARFAPGTDGVVDLYRMPAYDDVATLARSGDTWQLHYLDTGTPSPPSGDPLHGAARPVTRETIRAVFDAMNGDAES